MAATARGQHNQYRRTPRNPSECIQLEWRTSAPLPYSWRGLWVSVSWRIAFREDARRVTLSRFRLHCGEGFRYEYDFIADWKLDIRLERALPLDPNRALPSCIGGSRAAPPEECAGALDYLKRLDWHRSHLPIDELNIMAEAMGGFSMPMATATPLAIWTNCVRRSIG